MHLEITFNFNRYAMETWEHATIMGESSNFQKSWTLEIQF